MTARDALPAEAGPTIDMTGPAWAKPSPLAKPRKADVLETARRLMIAGGAWNDSMRTAAETSFHQAFAFEARLAELAEAVSVLEWEAP